MKRFKIDWRDSPYFPFGLFVRRRFWHTRFTGLVWWQQIASFETRDEIAEFYERIKSLPEYLD